MTNKGRIRVYPLIIMSVFLLIANSCKKDNHVTNLPATVTDVEGNVYHEISIGPQTWMVENLKTTKFRNGDPIPNVTDNTAWENLTNGAYCVYNNDAANITTFGMLYNWYAVNDSRKIAPDGWHIPTDAEWSALRSYLGGATVAGGKLKSTGTVNWDTPNTGASNSSGFSAMPGGYRYYGATFGGVAMAGYWWSATEYDSGTAWCRYLSNSSPELFNSHISKGLGFSVRCIKD